MLIEDKLQAMEARYQELNLWLSQPDAMNDQAKWRDALREQADLEEKMTLYGPYKQGKAELAELHEALQSGDPELAELAREEIPALEEQQEKRFLHQQHEDKLYDC